MDESKRESEAEKGTPKAPDDYFLFMGTRIPLGAKGEKPASAPPDVNAAVPESRPATPAAGTPETAAASAASTSDAGETKATFDLGALAGTSKPGVSSRIFMVGAAVLLAAVAALIAWHRFGSLEARILKAAADGQLVWPQGSSAYDVYQSRKADGLNPATKDKLRSEVLPKLSKEGDTFLKKLYEASNLTESEITQLIRIYEWAADLNPRDTSILARRAYATGYRASSKQANAEAATAFREAIQSDSQWPLPFRDLAKLHARLGDHGAAEYYYQQVVQLDPRWVLPRLDLASLYLERNRLAEAEINYRLAAQTDPSLPVPWYFLGQLYQRQKRNIEAIAAYQKALQLATQRPSSTPPADEIRALIEKLKPS